MINKTRFTYLFPNDLVFNRVSRLPKARKIIAVLRSVCGDLSQLECLDLGCSTGIITVYCGRYFKKVVGVDVDQKAIRAAQRMNRCKNVRFISSKENRLPFHGGSYDVVVCNQVYEHVENAKKLMNEIYRLLKPGGVCFLGARNKWGIPFDGHYTFPFLAWLPKRLADWCVRLVYHKDTYDIKLCSLWCLNSLVGMFKKTDYTLKIIANPKKFAANDVLPGGRSLNKLLLIVAGVVYPFLPNYIWILKKNE